MKLNVRRQCALSAILIGIAGCNRTPSVPAASYEEQATAFTVGTIALEAGDNKQRDRVYLTKLTQIAPEEPAGWANLGLLELRQNNLQAAAADMNKANAIAPNNAGIEKMLALLADRQGDLAGSIAHGKQAVNLDPTDLRAKYALAQELSRQNTPDGDAAYQAELQAIIDQTPYNLAAELELAVISSKRGDKLALQKAITLIGSHASSFTDNSPRYFAEVKTSAAGQDTRDTAIRLRYLQNTLKTNIGWKDGYNSLTRDPTAGIGDPFHQFIKLSPLKASAAAPDMATTFTPQPQPATPGACFWAGAIWLNGEGAQAIFTADSKGVHLPKYSNTVLPFPFSGAAPSVPQPNCILALDVNYDLKTDLLFAGSGGIKLYIQGKNFDFRDRTAEMKLPASITGTAYTAAWALDIEQDGDLDILLGSATGEPVVLRNNGDGTWLPLHPFTGIDGVKGCVIADITGWGTLDVTLIDRTGRLHFFENERGGLYHEKPLPASIGAVAAVAAADVSHVGHMDIVAIREDGAVLQITPPGLKADWVVTEIARWQNAPKDLTPGNAALTLCDLDNNGALDIVASTPSETRIWLADDKNGFAPCGPALSGMALTTVLEASGTEPGRNTKSANSGRPDLFGLSSAHQAIRFANTGKLNYHWQEVRPRAADEEFDKTKLGDRRINSFGIGGEVEARSGLLYTKLRIDSPVLHFGLGTHATLDAMRILWPNGDVRAEFADTLKPDMTIALPHRLKGSCPFLFAWNGKKFEFVTDCIWRSPLGLKINAQDTAGVAQTEDWVKIRGDQLQPDSSGKYDLRITAELWETHFFDHLSLLTVDHPAGTEIFVDERFAIPPPPHRVYSTGPLQPVLRAVDDLGTDVTNLIRARDGKHVDTFSRGDYQGVTRDHWIEVEIGDAAPTIGPLWLVCSGWIHPTDSSINVALGQGHSAPPRGLQIETPDAAGRWSVARSGLGFPEGKVKTILVDLNGVFKPGAPRKLRLSTNLEIYWDSIQWAKGMPTTGIKTLHMNASNALLQYRGFSEIRAADISSPELPTSYDQLQTTKPIWRDLEGWYTRYGNVEELLTKIDDRYVIMNAGDELRLKFDAPSPPPPGTVRDFVLIGDGWVKDGDFNTAFSRTVLPLPSHSLPQYNTPPRSLEEDPVYIKHPEDWRSYHTRLISPRGYSASLYPGK